jgi:hypothetical protein
MARSTIGRPVVDLRPNPAQACAAMEATSHRKACRSAFSGSAFRISPPRTEGSFRETRPEKYLGFRLHHAFHMIATGSDPIGGGAERTASDASSGNADIAWVKTAAAVYEVSRSDEG